MSLIKNNKVWEKYEEAWNIIKNKLGIKFHSEPIYENKYLKAKTREFDDDVLVWPAKRKYVLYMHCLHNYWFCFKNEQKNYPQVYLEECKCKIKKIHISRFINIELETDSESDVETDSESNTKQKTNDNV